MKMLIVEDDKEIAKFMKRCLEDEGYQVDVAYDGEEASELITIGSYSLIILDLMLTKKDGITLLKEIRQKSILTPVLVVSGKTMVEEIVEGLDAGADSYMTKPVAVSELIARVKALQRRVNQDQGAKIFFADLCLDPVKHRVWRNDVEIDISAKEYELLEYLVRHPNEVHTRTMIVDAVWGSIFDTFTNFVNVHIYHLRKKIDWGVEKKLIHTVRGVGYILKEEG